jgi:hypothetical protein
MYFFLTNLIIVCVICLVVKITRAEFGIGGFLGLGFEFVAESNGRCCGI